MENGRTHFRRCETLERGGQRGRATGMQPPPGWQVLDLGPAGCIDPGGKNLFDHQHLVAAGRSTAKEINRQRPDPFRSMARAQDGHAGGAGRDVPQEVFLVLDQAHRLLI